MNKKTQQGFTLYELLTTVLIVGVILALGVPNMGTFRQNSRMSATANDLHSSFHLARSTASRSKNTVTICASDDSMTATPSCNGQFEDGWIVFADDDGDIAVDVGEDVLMRFPAVNADITINSGGNDDYFSFNGAGQGRGNVTGNAPVATLVMCDSRGNATASGGRSAARVLVVTPMGRATVLRDKDQVTFHGGC